MKKAVIVTMEVSTRVIVDVEENGVGLSDNETRYAVEQAIDEIASNPTGYLTGDNLVKIKEDTEIPFGKGNSGTYVVNVTDIVWDVDDEDEECDDELPDKYDFHFTEDEYKEYLEDRDYITDLLSDMFGYCVESCNAEG